MTIAADASIPDSLRIRNRAGSAPTRAGVIDAAKSPPSDVRTDVVKGSVVPTAFAVQVSLRARVPTSTAKARNASRCAGRGIDRSMPCGALLRTAYTDTPITAANEIAVQIQRFTAMCGRR